MCVLFVGVGSWWTGNGSGQGSSFLRSTTLLLFHFCLVFHSYRTFAFDWDLNRPYVVIFRKNSERGYIFSLSVERVPSFFLAEHSFV